MVMDRFTQVALMLTLIIIGVNAHIVYFGDVVAPGQKIVPQPFQLSAEFVDVNVSEGASYNSSTISTIKGESGTQIILTDYVSNIPFIGPALSSLSFMFDGIYNMVLGYTAVLNEIFGKGSAIVTVIATILLGIQIIGLTLLFLNVIVSLRRTIG